MDVRSPAADKSPTALLLTVSIFQLFQVLLTLRAPEIPSGNPDCRTERRDL